MLLMNVYVKIYEMNYIFLRNHGYVENLCVQHDYLKKAWLRKRISNIFYIIFEWKKVFSCDRCVENSITLYHWDVEASSRYYQHRNRKIFVSVLRNSDVPFDNVNTVTISVSRTGDRHPCSHFPANISKTSWSEHLIRYRLLWRCWQAIEIRGAAT